MKKSIFAAVLFALITGGAFADGFWFGPTALYNVPVQRGELSETESEDLKGNLWYGADMRLELGILKGEATLLHIPYADPNISQGLILALFDVGVGLDVLIFNFGVGVGPNLIVPFMSKTAVDPLEFGVNLKANVGVKLGDIALNLYSLYLAENFKALAATDFKDSSFLMGMNVQFRL